MKQQHEDYEFVSAAMDEDGLSEEMLDKLLSDGEARQRWYEYHLIRDCMQSVKPVAAADAPFAAPQNLAKGGLENVGGASVRPAANHAFKGFAVAASVLAVAVGVWQFWPQGSGGVAAVAEKTAPSGQSAIVSVGGKAATAKSDAVANAEAQGAVVPNAARAAQTAAPEKQSAVRVEKLPESAAASAAK